MQKIIIQINNSDFNICEYEDIECFVLGQNLSTEQKRDLASALQKKEKIVLSEGKNATEECKLLKTDGIILDLSDSEHIKKDFDAAKKIVGNQAVIGTIVRCRRHEAMIAAECEPDFVAFKVWEDISEKQAEVFDWYQEFFLIQSAAVLCSEELCKQKINTDILIINEKKYKILVAINKKAE